MKKLIAFDLDGTLTQHKSPLGTENREVLLQLSQKYSLVMIGAGACERIYRQMNEFPIDIVGNYGLQRSVVENGTFKLSESKSYTVDRDFFNRSASKLRQEFGLTEYYGDSLEFHDSGLVTFAILGTAAPIEEKLAYDPDRAKRRVMYPAVKEAFRDYNVFIGGSSSFDITFGRYNKYNALRDYCNEKGIDLTETLFVGDDFGDGGNDSHIRLGGVDYVEIDNYLNFPEKMSFLLK